MKSVSSPVAGTVLLAAGVSCAVLTLAEPAALVTEAHHAAAIVETTEPDPGPRSAVDRAGNGWVVERAGEFGTATFRRLVLLSGCVRSLASGDLIEKDWVGGRTGDARRDAELVVGTDATGPDQISVWFNHYDDMPMFGAHRSYSRTAPNSVLCVAADSLSRNPAPFGARLDIVTGTALASEGNWFVWFTHGTRGNEGYLARTYGRAYRTLDGGDVQAVRTRNIVGDRAVDVVVGTRSPSAGRGTIEIWRSDDGVLPRFERCAVFPPSGSLPEEPFGEVTSLQFVAPRRDGKPDLVVGTRRQPTAGEVLVFDGSAGLDAFQVIWRKTFPAGSVTALATTDYDMDHEPDVVVALQTGTDSGELQFWRGSGTASGFELDTTVAIPGVPTALAAADLGGAPNPDIAVGFRDSMNGYRGGVRILSMDGGTPGRVLDPSNGTITAMVPAIVCDHFDAGTRASDPKSSDRVDLAAGVWSGPTTGALVVFVR